MAAAGVDLVPLVEGGGGWLEHDEELFTLGEIYELAFEVFEAVDGGGRLQGLESESLLALPSLVGVEEEEGSPS